MIELEGILQTDLSADCLPALVRSELQPSVGNGYLNYSMG